MAKKDRQKTPEQRQANFKLAITSQVDAIIGNSITPASLRMLAHFCESMANALTLFEDPNALIKNRFGNALMSNPGVAMMSGMPGSMGQYVENPMANAILPSTGAENYGTAAIRQLVGMAKEMIEAQRPKPSLTDVVFAINEAKKAGLTGLAEKLEQQALKRYGGDAKDDHAHGDHAHGDPPPRVLIDNDAPENIPPPPLTATTAALAGFAAGLESGLQPTPYTNGGQS